MSSQQYNSDIEDSEKSVEDRTFDLTVRKMKSKVYPSKLPKHVSEMSRFTDYEDKITLSNGSIDNNNNRLFKI